VEPWYGLFSLFEKKNCPFPVGHVEYINNEKIAGAPEFIPYTLIGKYRCTMKLTFEEDKGPHTDCATLALEVMDV
jgi:hypothetical protein